MSSGSAADDPPPAEAVADQLPATAEIPPNGGIYAAPHPGSTGCLIRRVPSDPGMYDFAGRKFKINVFFPSARDDRGLSVNWEGNDPEFETAESLLAKAIGERMKQYGGVVAVPFEATLASGVSVERNDSDESRHHCLLPELSRPIYDDRRRNQFLVYADKLLRAANDQPVRIAPRLPTSL